MNVTHASTRDHPHSCPGRLRCSQRDGPGGARCCPSAPIPIAWSNSAICIQAGFFTLVPPRSGRFNRRLIVRIGRALLAVPPLLQEDDGGLGWRSRPARTPALQTGDRTAPSALPDTLSVLELGRRINLIKTVAEITPRNISAPVRYSPWRQVKRKLARRQRAIAPTSARPGRTASVSTLIRTAQSSRVQDGCESATSSP
jgi:hypothetical protein